MQKSGFVYILASEKNGTLYIGVTSDLVRRIHEHRTDAASGFTKRYGVKKLVHFEQFEDMPAAITREKQLKKWNRVWKLRLIEEENPDWFDLFDKIAS